MTIIKGKYTAHITGDDWGCGVDKIIIHLSKKIHSIDSLSVKEEKVVTDWTSPTFETKEATFPRKITAAYLCNEKGDKVNFASEYMAIEMYISPDEGSPLNYYPLKGYNNWTSYRLIIEGTVNTSDTLDIKPKLKHKTTNADEFFLEERTYEGVTYNIASCKKDSDVLVVWLHGLGEGKGIDHSDGYIPLLGNKVTSLISDKFQSILNASILVPQCPTFWMDNDGKSSNFNGAKIIASKDCYYMDSLYALLKDYKEEFKAKKVIITGCSNGGYMSVALAMNYGDEFDAYVPICEAMPDTEIDDETIEKLSKLNMFFIYSEDDPIVNPTLHEIPTLKRINEHNPKNIKLSTTQHVIDTTGRFYDAEGNPYKYNGHWSWIYFDNNEARDNTTGIDVWTWMANQVK